MLISEKKLVRLVSDPQRNIHEHTEWLMEAINLFEEYHTKFDDDFSPKIKDYTDWITYHLDHMNRCFPWFYCGIFRESARNGMGFQLADCQLKALLSGDKRSR